jgi:hypothetical protein
MPGRVGFAPDRFWLEKCTKKLYYLAHSFKLQRACSSVPAIKKGFVPMPERILRRRKW